MERVEALRVVGDIAADQWGLFTTQQAEAAGVHRTTLTRLAAAGLVDHVSRGVHLVVAAGTPNHVEEKAAWLRLAPSRPGWERRSTDTDSGVFSHSTACVLHELGDVPAPAVEITVPRRRTTRTAGVRLHRGDLSEGEITTTGDGLPVTTVERTIRDLLASHVDGGHVGGVLHDAMRRGLVDVDSLVPAAAMYASAYGIGRSDGRLLLQHLLDQAGTATSINDRTAQAQSARITVEALDSNAQVRAVASELAALDQFQLRRLRTAVTALIQESDGNTSEKEADQ
ncbi:type IV toxin-antitoxin system AbiEi family antitoxin domain-containing protein [Lentzea albida]|uniref:Transcriptional regulator, AbiEi antitoxin, Type IV TA system n=1 Tax=Lentzea albida TaxID=65499 RepID=A0A1H9IMJ6_9PSEU|nr:type IV toxin-antitoxin system AbiEi family antitoxin domain-containing protein [Lentzea albida]SEQ75814.1 Transcriptional regulator, AbiEi antitoxin, Type IV TA system [Lentzea albida]